MVRGSLAAAVSGLPGLITVASSRPSADGSVIRAARPMPATIIAQTSATTTTFTWVTRSALSSEKLCMTPLPKIAQSLVAAGRREVQAVLKNCPTAQLIIGGDEVFQSLKGSPLPTMSRLGDTCGIAVRGVAPPMSCSPEGRADFVSSLVFEGQRHTGAKGGDFAVFDLHVHL